MTQTARKAELTANLAQVRDRIARACAVHGRDPADVELIAVTKTRPVSDVALLAELGVTDFGENRDAEAREKAKELPGVRWHFIGQLQRRKARSVADYADVIHSVDRAELIAELDRVAQRQLGVLLQVNVDPDADAHAGRAGADPRELGTLAAAVQASRWLTLKGVMGMAPLDGSAAPAFARLQRAAQTLWSEFPEASWVSAGMSSDLEEAIGHGATHVRVGGDLLGKRV